MIDPVQFWLLRIACSRYCTVLSILIGVSSYSSSNVRKFIKLFSYETIFIAKELQQTVSRVTSQNEKANIVLIVFVCVFSPENYVASPVSLMDKLFGG